MGDFTVGLDPKRVFLVRRDKDWKRITPESLLVAASVNDEFPDANPFTYQSPPTLSISSLMKEWLQKKCYHMRRQDFIRCCDMCDTSLCGLRKTVYSPKQKTP